MPVHREIFQDAAREHDAAADLPSTLVDHRGARASADPVRADSPTVQQRHAAAERNASTAITGRFDRSSIRYLAFVYRDAVVALDIATSADTDIARREPNAAQNRTEVDDGSARLATDRVSLRTGGCRAGGDDQRRGIAAVADRDPVRDCAGDRRHEALSAPAFAGASRSFGAAASLS